MYCSKLHILFYISSSVLLFTYAFYFFNVTSKIAADSLLWRAIINDTSYRIIDLSLNNSSFNLEKHFTASKGRYAVSSNHDIASNHLWLEIAANISNSGLYNSKSDFQTVQKYLSSSKIVAVDVLDIGINAQ